MELYSNRTNNLPTEYSPKTCVELSNATPELLAKCQTCLSNYGNTEKFLMTFSAGSTRDLVVKNSPEKLICSKIAPTITVIKATYGVETIQTILAGHLAVAAAYYGTPYSANSEQIQLIANMIIANHPDLKISEIILFFSKLEAGFFRDSRNNDAGKMYGNFNGEVIADCLHRFREYRASVIDKMEREEAAKRADAARNDPNAISYAEMCRRYNMTPEPLLEIPFGKVNTPAPVAELPAPKTETAPEIKPKSMADLMSKWLTPEQIERLKQGTLDPNDYIEDVEPIEEEEEEIQNEQYTEQYY